MQSRLIQIQPVRAVSLRYMEICARALGKRDFKIRDAQVPSEGGGEVKQEKPPLGHVEVAVNKALDANF